MAASPLKLHPWRPRGSQSGREKRRRKFSRTGMPKLLHGKKASLIRNCVTSVLLGCFDLAALFCSFPEPCLVVRIHAPTIIMTAIMSRKTRICHNRKVNRLLKNALTPCLQVSELQLSETTIGSWISNCIFTEIALKSLICSVRSTSKVCL